MSDVIRVEVLDPHAAIREGLDESRSDTRAQFLKKAAVAGGTLSVGGVVMSGLPALAFGASASMDQDILNFALFLEYLEAAFYTEAENKGKLSGERKGFAKIVGAHERAHRDFIKKALGSKARKSPTFDFRDTTTDDAKFVATAIALEDTGVGAYNGQGANLTRKRLAVAAQIVSVEARHAAWIRNVAREDGFASKSQTSALPAPSAFDLLLSKKTVQNRVDKTGFVKSS